MKILILSLILLICLTTFAFGQIVIEAEGMYHDNGGVNGDFWNLWSNGAMNQDVLFATTGTYSFNIVARGSLAFNIGPEMGLLIGNDVNHRVFVNNISAKTFSFEVEVLAGTHEFAIRFYNDYNDKDAGIDRNLYIDKTIITLLGNSVTLVWDANTEEDLAGYNLYQKPLNGEWEIPIDVGNVTEYTTLNDDVVNFALTAYDTSGNESEKCNAITYIINPLKNKNLRME